VPGSHAFGVESFGQFQRMLLRLQVRACYSKLILKTAVVNITTRQLGRQCHQRLVILFRHPLQIGSGCLQSPLLTTKQIDFPEGVETQFEEIVAYTWR